MEVNGKIAKVVFTTEDGEKIRFTNVVLWDVRLNLTTGEHQISFTARPKKKKKTK